MFSTATFTGLLHTGQVIIPVGTRCFNINVLSGQAVVNGTICPAPYSIGIGMPDSKNLLGVGSSIAVGASGVGNKVVVYWNS